MPSKFLDLLPYRSKKLLFQEFPSVSVDLQIQTAPHLPVLTALIPFLAERISKFAGNFLTITVSKDPAIKQTMEIRKADIQSDFEGVWEIFRNVISTGDTYVYDPDTPKGFRHKSLGFVDTDSMFRDLTKIK
ncbi:hypothetical protein [Niabella sp.]|uniref:hypothetical protein n=1 Tax=Niabella sp. TaxID=1962976 RepID=UPI002637B7FD|nr:hypothetical protein [Niabella sp.]